MTSAISLVLPVSMSASPQAKGGAGDDFFALAEARLAWLNGRQKLLAQNIANANTPDYRALDAQPFEQTLRGPAMAPALTDPAHIAPASLLAGHAVRVKAERSLDGNSVSIESQLVKVADDETATTLTDNLWKSTMGLFMTALGKAP